MQWDCIRAATLAGTGLQWSITATGVYWSDIISGVLFHLQLLCAIARAFYLSSSLAVLKFNFFEIVQCNVLHNTFQCIAIAQCNNCAAIIFGFIHCAPMHFEIARSQMRTLHDCNTYIAHTLHTHCTLHIHCNTHQLILPLQYQYTYLYAIPVHIPICNTSTHTYAHGTVSMNI